MAYYVSAADTFYGPMKAAKAYRRMIVESRRGWAEMLRKGNGWTLVA